MRDDIRVVGDERLAAGENASDPVALTEKHTEEGAQDEVSRVLEVFRRRKTGKSDHGNGAERVHHSVKLHRPVRVPENVVTRHLLHEHSTDVAIQKGVTKQSVEVADFSGLVRRDDGSE